MRPDGRRIAHIFAPLAAMTVTRRALLGGAKAACSCCVCPANCLPLPFMKLLPKTGLAACALCCCLVHTALVAGTMTGELMTAAIDARTVGGGSGASGVWRRAQGSRPGLVASGGWKGPAKNNPPKWGCIVQGLPGAALGRQADL